MISVGMTHEDKCEALAACIARAERISPGIDNPQNHAYWETREACMEVSKREGVKIQEYIAAYSNPKWPRSYLDDEEPPFWDEVASPRILLAEVLDQ